MTTARGTPISISVVEWWFWLAGGGDAELAGSMAELCDAVGALAPVRLEEEGLDVSVAVDNTELVSAHDCPGRSTVENGYGASGVKLVMQQSGPARPCPAAPAQHQPLPLGSQRFTLVKVWN